MAIVVGSIIISTSNKSEVEVLPRISTISHNRSLGTMCRATWWCLGRKIIWWMKCTSNSNLVWSSRTRCWRTCRGSLSSQARAQAVIHLSLISLTKSSSSSSSTAWIMRISNISSSYPSNCSRISCLYLCLHCRQWWWINPSTSSSSFRWYQTWTHTSRIRVECILTKRVVRRKI